MVALRKQRQADLCEFKARFKVTKEVVPLFGISELFT